MDKVKTTFTVSIPDSNGLTLPLVFKQDAAHKVWVDWGDKSYPDTYSFQGLIEASHKYKAAGTYIITMHAVDDGFIILGGGWSEGNAVGGSDEAAARMLISANIGSDVTGISPYAFRGCENLETVTFPNNHELTIGEFAFEGCCSLESIAIPKNISTIERGVFNNCSSLRTVTLPVGIYEIEAFAFTNCAQLKAIDLLGVTRIGKHAFSGCKMLREIRLGENCRFIGEFAFDSCSCVRSVNLGHAKEIGNYAFHNAKSLYEITIPDTVETIDGGAFEGCTSLTKIKMAAKEPPVLSSIHSFEMNDGMTITVPYGSKKKYQKDTNWAVFANAMVEG